MAHLKSYLDQWIKGNKSQLIWQFVISQLFHINNKEHNLYIGFKIYNLINII